MKASKNNTTVVLIKTLKRFKCNVQSPFPFIALGIGNSSNDPIKNRENRLLFPNIENIGSRQCNIAKRSLQRAKIVRRFAGIVAYGQRVHRISPYLRFKATKKPSFTAANMAPS